MEKITAYSNSNKQKMNKIIIPTKPIAKMSKVELMDFVKQIAPNKHFYPRTTPSARIVAQNLYDTYYKNIQTTIDTNTSNLVSAQEEAYFDNFCQNNNI